jgi:hypothetical protein
MIPRLAGAMPELHEANAALEKTPGDEGLAAVHVNAWSERMDVDSWPMSKVSVASICTRQAISKD